MTTLAVVLIAVLIAGLGGWQVHLRRELRRRIRIERMERMLG